MSSREETLSFPLGGLLRTLSVQVGSQVKKGDVLAELDAWDLETTVINAQGDVDLLQVQLERGQTLQAQQIAAAKADLDVARAQAALSAFNRDWQDQQIKAGKVRPETDPQHDLEYLTLAAAVDEARLGQAQVHYNSALINTETPVLTESLKLAQAKLERLQARLKETQLRAPFDGVIVALDARAGDNLQVYQRFGIIADPSQPILVADVFEQDLPGVSIGQPVTIRLDSYATRTVTGKVSQIGLQPVLSQGRNAYEVTISVDDPRSLSDAIRQGADVSISAQTKQDALLAPNRAIIREGVQTFVQVVRGGTATRVPVQVGVSDGTRTVVLAGLQEGDTVKVP
jgi:RND family efflux transporter MFP subunit